MKVYLIVNNEMLEGNVIGKYYANTYEYDYEPDPTYQVETSSFDIHTTKTIYNDFEVANEKLRQLLLEEETRQARAKIDEAEKALRWIKDNHKIEEFKAEIDQLTDIALSKKGSNE